MKLFLTFFFFFVFVGASYTQQSTENLIPNPSFESFRVRPLGWYYKGSQFNRVMKYWKSPTSASPDAYNKFVRVPSHWETKGFGKIKPPSGTGMVGLTVYGCEDGKPHCREYIQTQLIEELVVGQRYKFLVKVATLGRANRISSLGVSFFNDVEYFDDDRLIEKRNSLKLNVIPAKKDEWVQAEVEFKATHPHQYILLGNFERDLNSGVKPSLDTPSLNFGYVYLDDLVLKKLHPIVRSNQLQKVFKNKSLKSGESITLRNVYFDSNSDQLQPRSFTELNKLVKLLSTSNQFHVKIVGHTDNEGSDGYNLDLSNRRAATVVQYLKDKGIAPERLSSEGKGMREPVASNETKEGRQLNRRVVAEIQ